MTTPVPSKQPASLRKKLGWAAAILIGLPVLWTALFWQEITVYREFKRLCATDAGLKVFEKLEPGQVWEADSVGSARDLVARPEIALARAPDDKGKLVDVRALTHGWMAQSEVIEVNLSRTPRYRLVVRSPEISSDPPLGSYVIEVHDLLTQVVAIREQRFGFASSRQELPDSLLPWDHALFRESCPSLDRPTAFFAETASFFRK